VDPRREELVRLLQRRRRRVRLMLVCLVTALACGAVAGMVAPQMLIGEVPTGQAADGAMSAVDAAVQAKAAAPTLELSDRLALDPRETRANTMAWSIMPEPERRTFLDRYWRLAEMGEADRDRLLQRYALLRELPTDRQEYLRTRAIKLREFINTLNPQDQAVLESMSDRDRASRLLELWQTKYGAW
jgi:hypothetical protein